tara:strand:- start:2497 stop:2937 length:441 start_codon:yes stop_codon:yes gene_type:complete
MDPTFLFISAGIQALGYNEARKGVKAEGKLTVRNLKSQAKYRQLQGLQEHNQIMAQLQTFKDTNQSLAGVMGRDEGSDRSLKRLREKAKKNNATTIARANVQLGADLSKFSQQQQMATLKAKNLSRAYRYKMFSSFATAGYQASIT